MPTKAAYLALEYEPGLEFEFYLAEKLKMTVGELRARMDQDEFTLWSMYYSRIAQRQELENLKAR